MSADPAVNGMSHARAAGCLGLFSRGCCVHYSSEPEHRLRLHAEVKGPSTIYVRIGDEGGRVVFHFCPNCGATVHYQVDDHEDFIAVPVGAFGEPGYPASTVSVYEERKRSWVGVPTNMEYLA